jgi:cation diffusion facilitator CzcD-associated flavoprotein CzcO
MPSETEVIVIGAGQSGLAAARALQARGIRPVVLEAGPEPAGSWPHYYDSLTLFSPATHPGLVYVGLEFQRSFSSNILRGVYRDSEHVIAPLAAHVRNAPAALGL